MVRNKAYPAAYLNLLMEYKKQKKSKKSKKSDSPEKTDNQPKPEFIDGIYYEDKKQEERYFREGCIKYGRVPKFDKYERLDLVFKKKKNKPMRYFGKRAQKLMLKGVKYELQTSRIAEAVIERVEKRLNLTKLSCLFITGNIKSCKNRGV